MDGSAPPSGNGEALAPSRATLRERAEAVAPSLQGADVLSPEAMRQLLHELSVHQVELQMQNEELRRAQLELETSRARYFDLYDLAPVGYCSVGETGLIVQANLALATLLGVLRSALLRHALSGFIFTEDQDSYFSMRKRLIQTGQAQSLELRMLKGDGTPFWVHLEASAAQAEDGGSEQRIVLTDITPRKQAEAALQESESLWKFALEGAGDGVWDWRVEQGTMFFSGGWKSMLGFGEGEIGNGLHEWEQRLHPQDRALTMAALAAYVEGRTPAYVSEYRIGCKDGSWKWILDRGKVVKRGADGRPLRMIGTHVDITTRKLAEIGLRTLSRAIEQSPASIVITDREGRIEYVNPRFMQYSGYSKEEVLGQNPRLLQSGLTPASTYKRMWDRITAGGEWRGELCNRTKGGELYWDSATISGLHDEQGRISHYVAVNENLTERKGLQGKLRRATDRLQAITSNIPGMVFELERRGEQYRFTYVSSGARELFGFAQVSLPQALETLFSIIHEEDGELFLQSLEHSAQTRSLWTWVGQVTGPKGELRWVQVRGTPRTNEDESLVWDGIATDVTEAKTSELALNDTRQLLRVASVDREAVREGERVRIARELHDELGQVLTGVKLHLSALGLRIAPGEDALKTQAAHVMRLVDQAIGMTRSTVLGLRPPALDQGLAAAIAWLANQFTQRSGIVCSLNLPAAEIMLDDLRAVALFRILQESLTNITRHAGATKASIELRASDGRLYLQVVDDGKGFVQTQVVPGRNFGLLGMRERVAILGGHFDISSIEDVGTIVAIDVAMEGGTA